MIQRALAVPDPESLFCCCFPEPHLAYFKLTSFQLLATVLDAILLSLIYIHLAKFVSTDHPYRTNFESVYAPSVL